jgi:hypothetical protein
VGALVGARSCGRCGASLDPGVSWCHRCGVRVIPAMPGTSLGTYSGLLAGVQLATPTRRRVAVILDFLPVALLVLAASVLSVSAPRLGVAAQLSGAAGIVVYAVAHGIFRSRTGLSLGRGLLSLRTVDDLTGEPVPVLRLSGRPPYLGRGRTLTTDCRLGREPLVMAPAAQRTLASSGETVAVPTRGLQAVTYERPTTSPSIMLVLDTGERLELVTSVLIGRAPANVDGQEHPVFAWPDLGRSLTKTHAMLEWSGAVLWVTDLDSTNGTSIVSPDGGQQPLMPGLRGPAAPGYTITMGERSIEVHRSGALEMVEARAFGEAEIGANALAQAVKERRNAE